MIDWCTWNDVGSLGRSVIFSDTHLWSRLLDSWFHSHPDPLAIFSLLLHFTRMRFSLKLRRICLYSFKARQRSSWWRTAGLSWVVLSVIDAFTQNDVRLYFLLCVCYRVCLDSKPCCADVGPPGPRQSNVRTPALNERFASLAPILSVRNSRRDIILVAINTFLKRLQLIYQAARWNLLNTFQYISPTRSGTPGKSTAAVSYGSTAWNVCKICPHFSSGLQIHERLRYTAISRAVARLASLTAHSRPSPSS